MSRTVAVMLKPQGGVAVVVEAATRPVVAAIVRVAWSPDDSPRRRGELLDAALAEHKLSRAGAVLVVARDALSWQSLQLPPAPDEDLPGMVLMQAERDLALADDGLGFDFLPLEGDAEHPRRVLAIALPPRPWRESLETCEAAQLKLRHVVPEPFGWPRLAEKVIDAAGAKSGGAHVGVAVEPGWAALWGEAEGAIRIVRSVRISEEADASAVANVLGGELRRTLVAFTQLHPDAARADVWVTGGDDVEPMSDKIAAALGRTVHAGRLRELFDASAIRDERDDWGAMASLAAGAAAGERPLVDLLHPRRPPEAPSRNRTYSLAAGAVVALCALAASHGYRNLQRPLEVAAEADAQREAMAESIAGYAPDEKRVAEISRWQAGAADLPATLHGIATGFRPQPPDSADFAADKDGVLTKLTIIGPKATVEAALKDAAGEGPLEDRLREAGFRVDRGLVNAQANAVPDYAVSISESLQTVAPDGQQRTKP